MTVLTAQAANLPIITRISDRQWSTPFLRGYYDVESHHLSPNFLSHMGTEAGRGQGETFMVQTWEISPLANPNPPIL